MNSALPLLGLLLPMLVQAAQPNEALLQQAVSEGRVRPFHELMEVASRLPVRVLRVDLGEEDGVWLYELRLIDEENSVIKVGYRADNLEMVWLKGHIWSACSLRARPRKRSNGVSPRTYRHPVRPPNRCRCRHNPVLDTHVCAF